MGRILLGFGSVIGIIVSLMIAPDYERSNVFDRAFIAWIMMGTAVCIYGFVLPMLPPVKDDK